MKKLKVGIYSDFFTGWGGGVDFIATIAYALEASEMAETYLIIKSDSFLLLLLRFGKYCFESLFENDSAIRKIKKWKEKYENLIKGFEIQSPKTKKIYFKQTGFNKEIKLEKCLYSWSIDILFPVGGRPLSKRFSIPWIGYIPDFQHKYLTEFFSQKEIKQRDSSFENMLLNSQHVIVNAKTVECDIKKYYPNITTDIIVFPFKPWLKPVINDEPLSGYSLPEKYFLVSSQFWQHKSHITVFDALEELYLKGIKDLHVVCTGELNDYRNPEYVKKIKHQIDAMACKRNIHLLGYIPKDDHLKIMNGALGLIQASLFEGGPGAGGVIYALGLGLQCFVSDIATNREITGYDNVYFFEAGNAHCLAKLMKMHMNDKKISNEVVGARMEKNLSEYSNYVFNQLKRCAEETKCYC